MRAVLIAAAVLATTATPAALAATPCAEHIATIERRLNSEGALAVTGSTARNQAVAEGSPKALPNPPPGRPSTGDPGPNAQRISDARILIEKAKEFERQGNREACDDTMTEAKRLIGPLP